MICLDTCGTAGDTVCQDGGWKAFGSMCEFGTDCSDCGPRLLLHPPPSPPVFPPPHSGARDTVPGLAINLALGGCLLIAVLAVATLLLCNHKHRMQTAPTSSTRGPQQVELTVARPESQTI